MKPVRIQRKRTKGWRMPENALSVTRPSMFGNPFIVGKHGNACECVEKFRRLMTTNDHQEAVLLCEEFTAGERVTRHLRVGGSRVPYSWSPGAEKADYYLCFRHQIIAACRGRDLACYCALDQPCHADVLLELANPSSATGETPTHQETSPTSSSSALIDTACISTPEK